LQVYASRRVYEGSVIGVRVDEIGKPRGDGRHRVEVVEHSGGAAIIAMPTSAEIVLVRQYRHAVGKALWELPAGMIERGEDPALTAARELEEETGYTAKRMRLLRCLYPTPGYCMECVHLFAAEELSPGQQRQEDIEEIEVRIWPLEKAWALVESDQLADAKTQIGLSWAMQQTM
jgi:ADP-ribose pyrophosphatase